MTLDELRDALERLAPPVEVDAAWQATAARARTARRRQRASQAVGALLVLLVVIGGVVVVAAHGGDDHDEGLFVDAPATTVASPPVVATCGSPDEGVSGTVIEVDERGPTIELRGPRHAEFQLSPVHDDGETASTTIPGRIAWTAPIAPGTYEVRCRAGDDPDAELHDIGTVEVVDPSGYWVDEPMPCEALWWEQAEAPDGAVGPVLAQRFGPATTRRTRGYSDGDRQTLAITRDGEVLAVVNVDRLLAEEGPAHLTVGPCQPVAPPSREIPVDALISTRTAALDHAREWLAREAQMHSWPPRRGQLSAPESVDTITRMEARYVFPDELAGAPGAPAIGLDAHGEWVVAYAFPAPDGSPTYHILHVGIDGSVGTGGWRPTNGEAWPQWWDALPDRG